MFRFVICCVMPGLLDSADQYIPPMPPAAGAAAAGSSFGMFATALSVVRTIDAMDAAFWLSLIHI